MDALKDKSYEAAVFCFSAVSSWSSCRRILTPIQAVHQGYEHPCHIVQASRPAFTSIILQRRAYALYKAKQLEDALSDISIAIRAIARIKEPFMHYLAADIHVAMGSYDKALKSYKDGVDLAVKARTPAHRRQTPEEQANYAALKQLATKKTVDPGPLSDPFEHLPMDMIELVIKHGLCDDQYFALKCSWVSQGWRATINGMPSLWRTYIYNPGAKATSKAKIQAWAEHAGNRFNEIQLVDVDSKTAMKQINTTWKPFLENLDTLTLRGTTTRKRSAVDALAELSGKYQIRTLDVRGLGFQGDCYESLGLGLLSANNQETIETIRIAGIDLRSIKFEKVAFVERSEDDLAYGALRNLTVSGCALLNGGNPTQEIEKARRQPQMDPLHQVLRQAVNLEHLDFSCAIEDSDTFYAYDRPLIDLDQLQSLRIPPPVVWTIDIKTPEVRHLAFDLRQSVDRAKHVTSRAGTLERGLIPDLASFAVTGIDLGKLVTVELVINGSDTKERLGEWLRGMKNVEKLVVRSPKLSSGTVSQLSPWYSDAESKLEEIEVGLDASNTANRTLIAMFQEDVELCPKLKELHLTNMHVPETLLLALLHDRRHSKIASEITTLSLVHCTYLSTSANHQLDREIPSYSNIEHGGISRLNWKQLCDRWEVDVHASAKGGMELSKDRDSVHMEDVKPT